MITGYASIYYQPGDARTQFVMGEQYVERIMPGAFDRALTGNAEVVGLFNHDPSLILGRRSAGTLRMHADNRGLRYEIDAADTQISRDVVEHQRSRNVIGSSFGFMVDDEHSRMDGDLYVREIRAVTLRDVGPVTFPAYDGTSDVRCTSIDGYCMEVPESIAQEVRALPGFKHCIDVRAMLTRLDADDTLSC